MTISKQTEAEFKRALELIPPNVAKGLRTISPLDLPNETLYHISTNHTIREFIPCVTKRTMEGEDRCVPRICTSPSIAHAMLGYGAIYGDFLNWDESKGKYLNKAHWQIYGFDFDLAVKPSPKLLPNQRDTEEYWLITYSKDTRVYKPKRLGKVTFVSVSTNYVKGVMTDRLELVCEVLDESVLFFNGVLLQKGYWLLTVNGWLPGREDYLNDLSVTTTEITKYAYNDYVKQRVTMESIGELPPSAAWSA